MTIPSQIQTLVTRLSQELDETAQQANYGINLVRQMLEKFPNNGLFIQFFAYLSSSLLFVETYQRQVTITVERISATDVTLAEIQEAGEDLSTILGRVLEAKIRVERIINRLELLK